MLGEEGGLLGEDLAIQGRGHEGPRGSAGKGGSGHQGRLKASKGPYVSPTGVAASDVALEGVGLRRAQLPVGVGGKKVEIRVRLPHVG